MMKRKLQRGVTLIELMIVIVIVSILAAIAIPNYSAYTRKAQRKEAMAALLGLAQAMERFYAQNSTYACNGSTCSGTGSFPASPAIFPTQSPLDAGAAKYNLVIISADGSSYTLEAQPIGDQQKDGKLELLSTGVRARDKNLDGSYSTTEMNWSDN